MCAWQELTTLCKAPVPHLIPLRGEESGYMLDCWKWNSQVCQTSPLPRPHHHFLNFVMFCLFVVFSFTVLSTKCWISSLQRSCTPMLALFLTVFIYWFYFGGSLVNSLVWVSGKDQGFVSAITGSVVSLIFLRGGNFSLLYCCSTLVFKDECILESFRKIF